MHRDKRLGLALGILLLGIVAAFFFRNDSRPESLPPDLIDVEKIDEQIAENGLVPYLDGLEGDAAAATSVSQSKVFGGEADVWDAPGFLRRQQANADLPGASGPPSPIDTQATVRDGIPIPRENSAWEPVPAVPKTNAPPTQPVSTVTTAEGFVIHRVVHGDTLSGLAQRYLGSSARFAEIYHANRGTLKSPDDLRLGMALRIPFAMEKQPSIGRRADRIETRPVSVGENAPAVAPAATRTIEPPQNAPTKPASNRRFVPARRSPLQPRGLGERTGQADIPLDAVPGRLSQLPPISPPVEKLGRD